MNLTVEHIKKLAYQQVRNETLRSMGYQYTRMHA